VTTLPEWVSELIYKGESVSACLSLYKEMQETEREERAAEREMRKTEIEREVRLKELEFREKELSQGANRVHSSDIVNGTSLYINLNRLIQTLPYISILIPILANLLKTFAI
jgi:hypothetical protein